MNASHEYDGIRAKAGSLGLLITDEQTGRTLALLPIGIIGPILGDQAVIDAVRSAWAAEQQLQAAAAEEARQSVKDKSVQNIEHSP